MHAGSSIPSLPVVIKHRSPTELKPKAPVDRPITVTCSLESKPRRSPKPQIGKRSPMPPPKENSKFPQPAKPRLKASAQQSSEDPKPLQDQDGSPKLPQTKKPTLIESKLEKPFESLPQVKDKPANITKPWSKVPEEKSTQVTKKQLIIKEETDEPSKPSWLEKPLRKSPEERIKPAVKPRNRPTVPEKRAEPSELLQRRKSLKKKFSQEKIKPTVKSRTQKSDVPGKKVKPTIPVKTWLKNSHDRSEPSHFAKPKPKPPLMKKPSRRFSGVPHLTESKSKQKLLQKQSEGKNKPPTPPKPWKKKISKRFSEDELPTVKQYRKKSFSKPFKERDEPPAPLWVRNSPVKLSQQAIETPPEKFPAKDVPGPEPFSVKKKKPLPDKPPKPLWITKPEVPPPIKPRVTKSLERPTVTESGKLPAIKSQTLSGDKALSLEKESDRPLPVKRKFLAKDIEQSNTAATSTPVTKPSPSPKPGLVLHKLAPSSRSPKGQRYIEEIHIIATHA